MKKCVLAISSFPEFIPELGKVLDGLTASEGWDLFVVSNCGFRTTNDRILVKSLDFKYWNEAFYWFLNEQNYDVISLLDDDDSFEKEKLKRMDTLMEENVYVHNYAKYSNPDYDYNAIDNNTSCITIRTEFLNPDMFKTTRSLNDFFIYLNYVGKNGVINLPEYLTYIRFKPFKSYADFEQYLRTRYMRRMQDLMVLKTDFSLSKEQEKVLNRALQKYHFIFRNYHFSDVMGALLSFDRHVYKAFLDRNKGMDFFINEEYRKRYGQSK